MRITVVTARTRSSVLAALLVTATALLGLTRMPTTVDAGFSAATAATGTFTMAQATSGALWAWGLNASYQLGDGTTTARQVPTKIGTATTWTSLSVGSTSACGVRTDGTLWCWGSNTYAATGLGLTSGSTTTPTRIGSSTTWRSVSVGDQFACAVQTGGLMYCWGYHGAGSGATGDGRLAQGGISNDVIHPQQVGAAGVVWRSVSLGFTTGCAVRTDDTLWCWGANADGQVGDGTTTKRESVVQVAPGAGGVWSSVVVGERHACALRVDASAWCWGYNGDGRLGLGTTTAATTPQQVSPGTSWSRLVAGRQHTCGIVADATLRCWGVNGSGGLGDGTTTTRQSPVQVGSSTWTALAAGNDHSCGVRSDASLWCWGLGTSGQLGQNATSSATTPTRVVDASAVGRSASAVAAGAAAASTLAVGVS